MQIICNAITEIYQLKFHIFCFSKKLCVNIRINVLISSYILKVFDSTAFHQESSSQIRTDNAECVITQRGLPKQYINSVHQSGT